MSNTVHWASLVGNEHSRRTRAHVGDSQTRVRNAYQISHQTDERLESLTRHETLSTVCLRQCSDGSSIRYFTVTLNFDLLSQKFNAFISVP